jgi:tetratricopeptide (TPR) repeat protein
MKIDTSILCGQSQIDDIALIYKYIEDNKSSMAFEKAKLIFNTETCYRIHEAYAQALYRSGERFEALDIIESSIEKFGAIPFLIKSRAMFCIEMAELGICERKIDGKSVYMNSIYSCDDEQFVKENYKTSLNDLNFLEKTFPSVDRKYMIARIYQELNEYKKSNEVYIKLFNNEDYMLKSLYGIAENNVELKKYKEAEKNYLELLNFLPKENILYDKYADLKLLMKDTNEVVELKNKAIFYKNVPSFLDFEYNNKNYELLLFYGGRNSGKIKNESLIDFYKNHSEQETINLCIIILYLHLNHDNGIEEKAVQILSEIGKPSLNYVHQLFESNVSTCTISNLCEIMANIKDPSSWNYLKEYLHKIPNLPSTLLSPSVPEKIIKFDKIEGLKEVLLTIQPLLQPEYQENILFILSQFTFYEPLKELEYELVIQTALSLGYSQEEILKLKEKISSDK